MTGIIGRKKSGKKTSKRTPGQRRLRSMTTESLQRRRRLQSLGFENLEQRRLLTTAPWLLPTASDLSELDLADFRLPNSSDRITYDGLALPGDLNDPEATARSLLALVDPATDYDLLEVKFGLASGHTRLQQTAHGIPVFGAYTSVHQRGDGSIQTVHMEIEPQLEAQLELIGDEAIVESIADPTVSFASAVSIASDVNGVITPFLDPTGEVVWYPKSNGDVVLAWETMVSSIEPTGDFRTLIDAETGEVLHKENRVAFATGTGDVFLPNPYQTQGSGANLADNNDANSAALDAQLVTVTLERLNDGTGLLQGEWVDVASFNSPTLPDVDANEPTRVYQYTRDDPRFEQVVAYHTIDSIQAYFHSLGFDDDAGTPNGIRDFPTLINAHWNNDDQSFYTTANDSVHMGDGGVDDAEDADIIAHEYGHAVQHNQNSVWGGGEMGAMGEGFGDYLAASFYADDGDPAFQNANDACVGEWDATAFSGTNPPCLRRVDGDKMYPTDLVGQVHADGEIWSRALWDMRAAIGKETSDQLVLEHHFALPANSTMPDAARAILAADINLNGGANQAAIIDAFVDRGILDAGPEGAITLDADRYGIGDTLTITVSDTDLIASPTINVSLVSTFGDSESVTLTAVGTGVFRGTISSVAGAATAGSSVFETSNGDQVTVTYIDADDGTGNSATVSDTASLVLFTNLLDADFSDDVGAPFDEAFTTAGPANAWHLSVGRGADAGHSADDSFYFGAGEGANGGGMHGNNADGTVLSPTIDLTEAVAADLSFNHFLASESGFDFATVSVISGAAITTLATSANASLPAATDGFENARFDLDAFIGQSIQLAFRFTSDTSLVSEGWYIDDIIVRASIPVIETVDFGDAPFPYPTTLAEDGASHDVGGPRLGASVDSEADGIHSPGADADDNLGDDEDGVSYILSNLVASSSSSTTASLVVDLQQPGNSANFLNAWIDFNLNGTWDDPGEQIFTDLNMGSIAGTQVLSFSIPQDTGQNVRSGESVLRLRMSTESGLAPTGRAGDGEVEDHRITIADGSAASSVTVNVPDGITSLELVNVGGQTTLRSGAQVLLAAPSSDINVLTIAGTSANDTLHINHGFGNPMPLGSVVFQGGTQATAAGDTILLSGPIASTRYRFSDSGDGALLMDSSRLDYEGIETLTDNAVVDDRIFEFAGGGETITLQDTTSASDNRAQIFSTAGTPLTFTNPNASLTIDATVGSGPDAITLRSTDPALSADVSVVGDSISLISLDVGATNDVSLVAGTITDGVATPDVEARTISLSGNIQPSVLTIDGDLTLEDSDIVTLEIGGASPGVALGDHDQLSVTGAVTIGADVFLSIQSRNGFLPSIAESFTILSNDGVDPVAGTFVGLPDDTVIRNFMGSGNDAVISYDGADGTGNDVVITVLSPPVAPLIGIDFGGGTVPQNWTPLTDTLDSTLTDLISESGDATDVDVEITFDALPGSHVPYAPPAAQLPVHTNDLTGLDTSYFDTGFVELEYTDLVPGLGYEIYVFGGAATAIAQSVVITGETTTSFDQIVPSGQLFVNEVAGDSSLDLNTFQRIVVADAAGQITVRVDSLTGLGVAGIAIRESLPVPDVFIDDARVDEVTGQAEFRVGLSAAAITPVTLTLETVDGTALAGQDYTHRSAQVTIPAGLRFATTTFDVAIIDNGFNEPNESFTVEVVSVDAGIVRDTTDVGTGTIVDDDESPTVQVRVSPAIISETGDADVTVSLSTVAGADVIVDLTTTGTATNNTDFSLAATQVTIPAGQLSAVTTVSIIEDQIDELNETINFVIAAASNADPITGLESTLTIVDDDVPQVEISGDTSTISEAGGSLTVTATLDRLSSRPVTINLTPEGAATFGVDYQAPDQIIIPAGDLTATYTITAIPDNLDEIDETLIHRMGTVLNAEIGTADSVTAKIIDDNPEPTVGLSFDLISVPEFNGLATLSARLSEVSSLPVTVNLDFGGDALGNDVDYSAIADTITIPAGALSASIAIRTVADNIHEPNEDIIVASTSIGGGQFDGNPATLQILDDDTPPTVALGIDRATIPESGGSALVTASLSEPSALVTTVNLSSSGIAIDGVDYQLEFDFISIPAGATSASVAVLALSDIVHEPNEALVIAIDTVDNATENGSQQVSLTIIDDELTPQVSYVLSQPQMDEEGGSATLTAMLSIPSSVDVTTTLFVTGTATGGGIDFAQSAASIVIPAGQTSASILFSGVPDTLNEGDEQIDIAIGSVTNGETSDIDFSLRIVDNDPVPAITYSVDNLLIDEATGRATITATLDGPSGLDVVADLDLGGTASLDDYQAVSSQIIIPAGETVGTAVLRSRDDFLSESDETIIIQLVNVQNASHAPIASTVTIADDDLEPSVSLAVDVSTISEVNESATITVQLSEVAGRDVTIDLAYLGTTDALDFSGGSNQLVIPAGQLNASTTLTTVDDNIFERNEVIDVQITSVDGAFEAGEQLFTILVIDDEAAPTVTLSSDVLTLSEDGAIATISATLSEASGLDVLIDLAITGSAENIADYQASATQISIAAGQTTGSIQLTTAADELNEFVETIDVRIATVSNAVAADNVTLTHTIIDDDALPTIATSLSSVEVDESAGAIDFIVTLSAASGRDITVTPSVAGTAGATDFALPNASLVIPAGQTTGSLPITISDDGLFENSETIIIEVISTDFADLGTAVPQTVTIVDNDAAPTIQLGSVPLDVQENGEIRVSFQISEAAGRDITAAFDLSGIALPDVDYTTPETNVTILAGTTSTDILIPVLDDTLDEFDESVTVTLSSADGAVLGDNLETNFTILDNDVAPAVSIGLSEIEISEDGGTTTLTTSLDAPASYDTQFEVSLTGGATQTEDYTIDSVTFTIPAGQTEASVDLVAVDDDILEPTEGITLLVASQTQALRFSGSVSVSIIDDELPLSTTLDVSPTSISESESATVTVTLSGASSLETVIELGFDGSASASDFSVLSDPLTFAPGETTATVQINAVDDAIVELDETINVFIQSISDHATAADPATLTLTDNELPGLVVTTVSDPVGVREDGTSALITVALTNQPLSDVTLNISVDDPTELGISTTSLTFSPDQFDLPQTITVTGLGDLLEDGDVIANLTVSVDPALSHAGYANVDPVSVPITNQDQTFTNLRLFESNGILAVEDVDSNSILFSGDPVPTDADPLVLDFTGVSATLVVDAVDTASGTIHIVHQADDTVDFGDGWSLSQPSFAGDDLRHTLVRHDVTIQVFNNVAFVNPHNRFDINRDGSVGPIDALIAINALTSGGVRELPNPAPGEPTPEFYLDANEDQKLSALDALVVLNFINQQPGVPAELEFVPVIQSNARQADGEHEHVVDDHIGIGLSAPASNARAAVAGSSEVDAAILSLLDETESDDLPAHSDDDSSADPRLHEFWALNQG